MKNSKKRVRLLLVMGVVFSNGVVLAALREMARTEPVSAGAMPKEPVEPPKPRDVFWNQLHSHLMVHKDPKEQKFRPGVSGVEVDGKPSVTDDPALNSPVVEADSEIDLTPEQRKALDKLNKPRGFFNFLNGRLPTGKKGVKKQVELTNRAYALAESFELDIKS